MIVALLLLVQDGPLSPEEALKTFRGAEGFRVELVAAEPDVVDPVAMAFDEDGRLYVVEMRDYPVGPPAGRVSRLEDRDGDGRMDRAAVFAADLPSPTAVLPWRGGVLVAASPEILYLQDTDGDGKADVRRVVLDGFGKGNQQHRVNGLLYGLDNWVYAANGGNGGDLRPRADGPAVSIRGSDFRFRPDTGEVEPVTGMSQYGNAFDAWGRRFICKHDVHVIHPVFPAEALRRNPHLAMPEVVDEKVSDHGHTPRHHRVSKADAHFTTDSDSSCSLTFFNGDAFVCEPVINLVHRCTVAPRGASFAARESDRRAAFLASTDNWFRPVNLALGPDGGLYVVDMYRLVIEHPDYMPKELARKLDLRAGADRGRIYRVVAAATPRPRPGSNAELVANLAHPNPWARITSQRLLVERRATDVRERLERLAAGPSAEGRLHALWTLEGLSSLDDALVERALSDPEPGVRENALRLAESRGLRDAVLARAGEPDPRVRFQLALSLGAFDDERAVEVLSGILAKDGGDRWTRRAVLLSGGARPLSLLARVGDPDLVRGLSEIVAARGREEEALEWIRRAKARETLAALASAARARGADFASWVSRSGAAAKVEAWRSGAEAAAGDASKGVAERVAAVEFLGALGEGKLERLLRPQEPAEVQVAAARLTGVARVLEGWGGYTLDVRKEILRSLLGRPGGPEQVLGAVEKGTLRPTDLDASQRDALLKHGRLRDRARKAFASVTNADREGVVREVERKLGPLQGDRTRGMKVYVSNCASCHRLAGQGVKVGPDLESVRGRDAKALLVDLLDPGRAVDPSYQMYVVETASKELLSGIVVAETPSGLTLRRAAGEERSVLRRDIGSVKAAAASLMPEGVEANLTPQDFADLLDLLRRGP